MMHLLIPADPFNPAMADDSYRDEAEAFRAAGCAMSLFSQERFERGEFWPRPALPEGANVLYRGWMLTPDLYARLVEAVAARGASMRTPAAAYRLCHYLPSWYALCRDLTPPTIFATEESDFATLLATSTWPAFFVKDYVKSLTTTRGSVARSAQEVAEVVTLLRQYRGHIEGGVCIREYIALQADTEQRYFVTNGVPQARVGEVPAIVRDVSRRIDSPFYSVDICLRADGEAVLIELGDGQVSDPKKWPLALFAEMATRA